MFSVVLGVDLGFNFLVDFLNTISQVFISTRVSPILVNSFHCFGPVCFIFGVWLKVWLWGWLFLSFGVLFLGFKFKFVWPHTFSVGWLFLGGSLQFGFGVGKVSALEFS